MKMSLDKIFIIFIKELYGELYKDEYSNFVATLYSSLLNFSVEIRIGHNVAEDIFISEIIREWHVGVCRNKFADFLTL
jgi:hypothetical protein